MSVSCEQVLNGGPEVSSGGESWSFSLGKGIGKESGAECAECPDSRRNPEYAIKFPLFARDRSPELLFQSRFPSNRVPYRKVFCLISKCKCAIIYVSGGQPSSGSM